MINTPILSERSTSWRTLNSGDHVCGIGAPYVDIDGLTIYLVVGDSCHHIFIFFIARDTLLEIKLLPLSHWLIESSLPPTI